MIKPVRPIPEAPDHAKRAADAFHENELESDTPAAPESAEQDCRAGETYPQRYIDALNAEIAQKSRLLIDVRKGRMTEETRAEAFRAQRDALAVIVDAVRTECEAHADGSPDASPKDRLANRILGMLS